MMSTSPKSLNGQQGIGLIELLVSMLIGLFIMAGVLQMFATSTQNAVASTGANKIQENIRYTLNRMADDIGQTGNLGCMSASTVENATLVDPVNNLLEKLTAPGQAYNFEGLVFGRNNLADTVGIADGTDDLTLRYINHSVRIEIDQPALADATTISVDHTDDGFATLQEFQIVAVSDCTSTNIFMIESIDDDNGDITFDGSNDNGNVQSNNESGLLSPIFPNDTANTSKGSSRSLAYLYAGSTGTYRYYIDTSNSAGAGEACDPADDDDLRFCALFRASGNVTQELVQGVHDLQIRYGRIDAAGELEYADTAPGGNWELVDRMEVTLSFNSVDNAAGANNTVDRLLTKSVTQIFNLPNQL